MATEGGGSCLWRFIGKDYTMSFLDWSDTLKGHPPQGDPAQILNTSSMPSKQFQANNKHFKNQRCNICASHAHFMFTDQHFTYQ